MRVSMTEAQYQAIREHLYPGDGKEAVSLVLCGRQLTPTGQERLLVREIFNVSYDACRVRTPDRVTWDTSLLVPIMEKAMREGLGILKVHSHPTGHRAFSSYDDESDLSIFGTITCVLDDNRPHASLIMLPDGGFVGRGVSVELKFSDVERITVVGELIRFYSNSMHETTIPGHSKRTAQVFGDSTYTTLRNLRIGVVGASGTGGLIIDALSRSGVGEIVLLDPKCVEEKNLNRIVYTTMKDAKKKRAKVKVLKKAIEQIGMGIKVIAIHGDLFNKDVISEIAACDIVVGCMDTAEGRNLLNRLANFYLLPYFDVGVSLDADGKGGISAINGGVHYLRPGGSSLLSRGVITSKHIQADALYRTDPDGYHEQRERGYVHGVNVERPAVMPINMVYSGLTVVEILARLHGYRYDDTTFAQQYFRLDEGLYSNKEDGDSCPALSRHLGRGDVEPILDMVL